MESESRQVTSSIPEQVDCLIIGAGIAGLSCAHYLRRSGKRVLIVEKSSRCGGWINTENRDGFLLETGPNTALAKQDLLALVSELALDSQVIEASSVSKLRYLAPGINRPLQPFPLSPFQALTTNIVSGRAKLRLLAEPFISPTKAEDLSLAEFCTRRFGAEVTKKVLAAVVNGILAPDIETLSARSAFPLLWELEQTYGSIVRGAISRPFKKKRGSSAAASQTPPPTKSRIISFRRGLSALVDTLSLSLADSLLTSTAVSQIRQLATELAVPTTKATAAEPGLSALRQPDPRANAARNSNSGDNTGYEVTLTIAGSATQSVQARSVISTESTADVVSWLRHFDQSLAEQLAQIPYTAIGIVHFVSPLSNFEAPVNGFGFLAPPTEPQWPSEEKLITLGTIFSSSLFPHTAPSGEVLLTTFVGGMRNRSAANVEQPEVLERVQFEVSKLLRAKTPLQPLRAVHVPRAIPNPAVNHFRLVEEVRAFEAKQPGLYFLGNWLEGVSLNDRVRESRKLAARLIA